MDAGSRLLELQRVERERGRERGGSSEVGTAEWCARQPVDKRFFFKSLTRGWKILFLLFGGASFWNKNRATDIQQTLKGLEK